MTVSQSLHAFGLVLLAAAIPLSAARAAAPARLVKSAPAPNSHVEWPKQVRLLFSARIDPASAAITMIKPDGSAIPMEAPIASDANRRFVAEVKQPMLPGPYMVQWRAKTAKGAPLKGDYTFFVQ